MRILLTNDDGIYSEGIYALYIELKKLGTVTVVAPDSERSSVGHGITLSHPIFYKKIRRRDRFFGYAVSGTPADSVKFAISILLKAKPNLIVSGVNLGANDGCSVFYSGTVAAAREGALFGIPSIAVSLNTFVNPHFKPAAHYAARCARIFLRHKIPRGTFLNVNVPHAPLKEIKGIKVTRQGTQPIHSSFKRRKDPNLREYYWMTGRLIVKKKDVDVDIYALKNNYVTVTPIQCDSTDYNVREQLSKLNLA